LHGESPVGLPDDGEHIRAARALSEAFERLAPQGTDAWNFLAAFTHLGDRYGPYHPGASMLSNTLETGRSTTGRRGRLRRNRERQGSEGEKSELEDAMAQVVEAFRFLSSRVATLEARLAAEDRPVEGAAWLIPARELGPWTMPVVAHVVATTPGGNIVHADCGEGMLLDALTSRGLDVHGVEPRGAVALSALERGCSVTIAEASAYLRGQAQGSLGGIVLSGLVDRMALHDLLSVLVESRRTLGEAAPLVVISEHPTAAGSREPPASDLVEGRSVHDSTWELLLERAGFVQVAPLLGVEEQHQRFALVASTPS
jgi:hypothetical protein